MPHRPTSPQQLRHALSRRRIRRRSRRLGAVAACALGATLALIVIALGTLFGSAAYASGPVFAVATVVIGGWLLAFYARERLARARHR